MPVKLSRVQLHRDARLLYSAAGVYRNAGGQECRVMLSCGSKDLRGSCSEVSRARRAGGYMTGRSAWDLHGRQVLFQFTMKVMIMSQMIGNDS